MPLLEMAKETLNWRLRMLDYYVRLHVPLDVKKRIIGNSVFSEPSCIMLPILSGNCSLNPQVDRLLWFCEMQISAKR